MAQVYVGQNYLITTRSIDNTAIGIISAMLGSIAGLLAVFGKGMTFTEKSFEKIKNKIEKKKKVKNLKIKRKNFLEKSEEQEKLNKGYFK